jgi:broad specificity phosphatase PhoE
MKIWILVCGEAELPLPKRCTGAAYELALAAREESGILPYTGRTMKAAGRTVYVAPGRRARETAERMIPGAEFRTEPLLAPIPRRAWKDTEAVHPLWLWQTMASWQARAGNPRQPESRQASIERAEALLARLEAEEKDCVLVLDGDFLTLLLDRLRLHGCSSQRSGLGRWQPLERILASRRDQHCGGCAHNCLLANPGCGIGRDKARRLEEGYRA